MNTEKDALTSMLEQYETNNKPRYEKKSEKVYDLKNYFNVFIKEGVKSATKQIRILPTSDGSSPFVEMHAHKAQIDGDWKTLPCLKHEKKEACPFCEAREALLATGKETDKELAKKYNAKMVYIVKVIDRANEAEGVKFWRFNHDYRREGIYDKIIGVLNALKKDVTNPETGRDLVLTINRNQNGVPVVSAVASLDPSKLSEDAEQVKAWVADERTWEDVYAVRSYDFMEIVVKGGVPAWSKEDKRYVDKASLSTDKTETEKLDTELTLGVENIKDTVKAGAIAEPVAEAASTSSAETEDDLPF